MSNSMLFCCCGTRELPRHCILVKSTLVYLDAWLTRCACWSQVCHGNVWPQLCQSVVCKSCPLLQLLKIQGGQCTALTHTYHSSGIPQQRSTQQSHQCELPCIQMKLSRITTFCGAGCSCHIKKSLSSATSVRAAAASHDTIHLCLALYTIALIPAHSDSVFLNHRQPQQRVCT